MQLGNIMEFDIIDTQNLHSSFILGLPCETDCPTNTNNTSISYGINEISTYNLYEHRETAEKAETNHIKKSENIKRKLTGLPYIGTNGKFILDKVFVYVAKCCDSLCCNKFTKFQQEKIFQEFYSLADLSKQNNFINHHVTVKNVKRHYTTHKKFKRKNSRIFQLIDENGEYITVCKNLFKSLLHISDGRIDRVLRRKNEDAITNESQSYNYIDSCKESITDLQQLISQLPSFCATIGCQRITPDLELLSPGFAILYKEYCDIVQSPISKLLFNHICNSLLILNESLNELSQEDNLQIDIESSNVEVESEESNSNKKLENSQKFIRKQNRASGLSYTNSRGKIVPAKVHIAVTKCCVQKCHAKFPEKLQVELFNKYYGLGSFNKQSKYIFDHINVISVARHYKSKDLRQKNKSRKYFLPTSTGSNIQVCKNLFKQVLAVSDGRIDRVLRSSEPPLDKRGQHTPANKTPNERVQEVNSAIDTFVEDVNNYNSKGKICIRKMYNYYVQNTLVPVSEHVFRSIYNSRSL